MARIVHLTSVHPADDVRIFHKECRSLADAGHEVILIAPCAADGISHGVKLQGIPQADSRPGRMFATQWRLYRAATAAAADVYHYHDPELTMVAVVLKSSGKTIIYDAHEDLPRQVLDKAWIPPLLRHPVSWLARGIEWVAGRICSGVVVAAPVIGKRFPSSKVCLVRNFARPDEFPEKRLANYAERAANLVYVGAITEARGIREMIRAVELLPESLNARLIVAGNFMSDALLQSVREMPGWRNVDYRGWQDREQIRTLLADARIGLNLLHPTNHYIDQPYGVKVFEYMASGIPSIVSNFPVWQKYADDNDIGMTADPLNPADIAAKAQYLLENPQEAATIGRRARQAFERRFSWTSESRSLIELYDRILEAQQ